MPPAQAEDPERVLVVDDQHGIVDLYAAWLRRDHDVVTATSGAAGLEAIDESVDVAFLDRRMPGCTGDEMVATIAERGLSPYVVLVTAAEPGPEIVSMAIDDYLHKPVSKADLETAIRDYRICTAYDGTVRELNAKTNKHEALAAGVTEQEHTGHPAVQALAEEI